MSLFLRGSTWHMKFAIKGVQVYKSTCTSIKRDAERIQSKRRAEVLQQVQLGGLVEVKLHAAVAQFLGAKSHLPSHNNAENRMAPFLVIPDKQLHRVTDAELQGIVESCFQAGQARSTVKTTVDYWNAFVKYCVKKKYRTCSRLETVTGVEGKIRSLSDAEQTALFQAIAPNGKNQSVDAQKQDNLDLCWMLLHTGARYAEIADMDWGQVNFKDGTIYLKRGKGGRDSTVHMTKKLREVLQRRRQMESGEYVFSCKKGRHNETHWMKAAVERAGLSTADGSVTLHTLRHTAAIRWLKAGLSLPEVQQMLGHASIKSTMVYLNFVPTEVAKRAAAMIDATQAQNDPAPLPLRLAA